MWKCETAVALLRASGQASLCAIRFHERKEKEGFPPKLDKNV